MDRTLALIEQAHHGDKAAREMLVEENLGLVFTVVKRFQGRGCEMEDLVQIGSIGLLKAIDKFDSSYDVKFSTYAVPLIAGEIKRFLRDEEMILALESSAQVESIYRPVYQGDGSDVLLMDKLEEKENANERVLNHMLLEQLLKLLGEQERQLIDLRYFHDKTQMETARELGISQVQVSRMEKKILQKMRGKAQGPPRTL